MMSDYSLSDVIKANKSAEKVCFIAFLISLGITLFYAEFSPLTIVVAVLFFVIAYIIYKFGQQVAEVHRTNQNEIQRLEKQIENLISDIYELKLKNRS